jgi:environmental stress-induced protein Ves
MSWNIVHLADVDASPWRNGGGVTRELVAWPAQGEWHWRMSVAEVGISGPFSRFDGITRWFAVLQGAGVVLNVGTPLDGVMAGAVQHRLTATDAPLCFDGGVATDCQLINGPTQDFNLMVRNSSLTAHMARVHGDMQRAVSATKTIAVYAMNTGASVQFDSKFIEVQPFTLVWRIVTQSACVRVEAADALWMEMSA